MFQFVNAVLSTSFGFAATITILPLILAMVISCGMKKMSNYQEREKTVRRMHVNMIRRQYGQSSL